MSCFDTSTLTTVVAVVLGTVIGAVLGIRSAFKNWKPKK